VLVLDDDVLVRMPVVQLHFTDTFDLGGLRGATSNKYLRPTKQKKAAEEEPLGGRFAAPPAVRGVKAKTRRCGAW
jgi:hypothetical protein